MPTREVELLELGAVEEAEATGDPSRYTECTPLPPAIYYADTAGTAIFP